jgi:diacylglycerol kinase (ATP)
MQNKDPQKFLFVINPVAGINRPDWKKIINENFKELPHSLEIFEMTGNSDTQRLLKQKIASSQPDRVIAVGGDGTLKTVAETLFKTNIPMGIIPAGSANGMARELEIPVEIDKAFEIILGENFKRIDLIKINDELCMHLSDIGLNALLIKYFEKSKRRGMWGYARYVIKVLWQKQLMNVEISFEKNSVRRKAFMVVIANASRYGTGATVNPEGKLDDGLFEIVIIRKLAFAEILKALFTHSSFDPEKIEVISTKSAIITPRRWAHFQVDGEYKGKVHGIKAEIVPDQLSVMVPPIDIDAESNGNGKILRLIQRS